MTVRSLTEFLTVLRIKNPVRYTEQGFFEIIQSRAILIIRGPKVISAENHSCQMLVSLLLPWGVVCMPANF